MPLVMPWWHFYKLFLQSQCKKNNTKVKVIIQLVVIA